MTSQAFVDDMAPSIQTARRIAKLFAAFGPEVSIQPLQDFSRFRASIPAFCRVEPRTAEEVGAIVALARAEGIPVRTRGQGHSLNGSSLPEQGELVVSTRRLAALKFSRPTTVTAGGGAVLWTVQRIIERHGFRLPVINDGYPAPSVGGFVAAGGFGPESVRFGGFWDAVDEVALVDGCGELRRIQRRDAVFPWLFGSMGQLGLVVEARLDVHPATDVEATYPLGAEIPAEEVLHEDGAVDLTEWQLERAQRLYWMTLFLPPERTGEARRWLKELQQRHAAAWHFRKTYVYRIAHVRMAAPLIYPRGGAFAAVGAWGVPAMSGPAAEEGLRALELDFMTMVRQHGVRRYIQSELAAGPDVFAQYFGPAPYAEFAAIKRAMDPDALFNRRNVFPGPTAT
jgi:FAD/FMN-containing dehydrogenase